MSSKHFVNAVRTIVKGHTPLAVDADTRAVVETIATLIGGDMPSPYGAQMVGRVRTILAGEEGKPVRTRKADKSPAQRARGAQRPRRTDRTESVAVVEERKSNKRKAVDGPTPTCPECGSKPVGFHARFFGCHGGAVPGR